MAEVFYKRGRWIVRFLGRQFKYESEELAVAALEVFEREGLPNR
jgi:hypothetical protein